MRFGNQVLLTLSTLAGTGQGRRTALLDTIAVKAAVKASSSLTATAEAASWRSQRNLQMIFDSSTDSASTSQLQSFPSLVEKDHLLDSFDVDHQTSVPQVLFSEPYHSNLDDQRAKTEKCSRRKVSWGILFVDSVLWLAAGALAALAAMAPSGDTFLGEIFVIATLGS